MTFIENDYIGPLGGYDDLDDGYRMSLLAEIDDNAVQEKEKKRKMGKAVVNKTDDQGEKS